MGFQVFLPPEGRMWLAAVQIGRAGCSGAAGPVTVMCPLVHAGVTPCPGGSGSGDGGLGVVSRRLDI